MIWDALSPMWRHCEDKEPIDTIRILGADSLAFLLTSGEQNLNSYKCDE